MKTEELFKELQFLAGKPALKNAVEARASSRPSSTLTEDELCRQAILRVGTAEQFGPSSQAMLLAKSLYPQVRDSLLLTGSWTWAMKSTTVAESLPRPEYKWAYRYAIPSDCLRVFRVNDQDYATGDAAWEVSGNFVLSNSDSGAPDWVVGRTYEVQNVVSSGGAVYVCRAANTNKQPGISTGIPSEENWQYLGDGSNKRFDTTSRTSLSLVKYTNNFTSNIAGPTSYTSFASNNYSRYVYEGHNVALLVPENYSSASNDAANVRKLTLACDNIYNFYFKITGKAPVLSKSFNNKTTLAFSIDPTCGYGCALVGFTGQEFAVSAWSNIKQFIANDEIDTAIPYEFGRNFWFYTNKLGYLAQDIMAGAFAIYNRLQALKYAGLKGASYNGTPYSVFYSAIKNLLYTYVEDSTKNWDNTLKVDVGVSNSLGLSASDLFASICLDLSSRFPASFDENVWKISETLPDRTTSQDAADNFIIASSRAVNRDLRTLFSYYKFNITSRVNTELSALGLADYNPILESNSSSEYIVTINGITQSPQSYSVNNIELNLQSPAPANSQIVITANYAPSGWQTDWDVWLGSAITLEYIRKTTEVTLFDSLFIDLLTANLASKLAVPLTGDANKAALLAKETDILGKNPAMRRDSTERKGRIKPAWMSSKLVSSRNGGDGIEAQAKAGGSGGGVSYPSLLVTVGSVTNLPTGSTPTVSNVGTGNTAVLNFGLPQGPAGTVNVGTTTTGAEGTNASVAATGTPENRVLSFTIPRGNKGDAATVAVGSVSTGNPGTNASVTNAGTSAAAVLNFAIPRGDVGAIGPANSLSIGTVATGPTAAATITGTAPNQTLNLTLQQSALLSSAKTTLTGNGTLKTFTVTGLKSSDPNHVLVAINGVLQEPTTDYLVNQGAGTITFATAIPNNAKIVVVALGLYSPATQRDPDNYIHSFALNTAGTFSYYGLLLNSDIPATGSPAAVAKWTITRSALSANGSVTTTAKATNVAWTNRETATYA